MADHVHRRACGQGKDKNISGHTQAGSEILGCNRKGFEAESHIRAAVEGSLKKNLFQARKDSSIRASNLSRVVIR